MPRIIGFVFDLIHDFGWRLYITYLKAINVEVIEFGDCKFICDQTRSKLVNQTLESLNSNCPEVADLLKKNRKISFIIKGSFPSYQRLMNLKFLIHKNTADYGIDGILSIIGFSYILELERKKRGTLYFRLFPPNMDLVKSLWLNWMKKKNIDIRIIQFYESAPLVRI